MNQIHPEKLKVPLLVLVIVLFSVLSACFGLFLFIRMRRGAESQISNQEPSTYQLLNYDPETKEIYRGLATLFDSLGENEFLSHETGEGKHVLISNFGSREFRCTGICYCDDASLHDEERRTSSTVISRSLLYLVAASSSVFAVNSAREYFSETCSSISGEELECHKNDLVLSEVEECEEVTVKEEKEEEEEEEGKTDSKEGINRKAEYVCMGRCYPNTLEYFNHYKQDEESLEVQKRVKSGVPKPVDIKRFDEMSHEYNCENLRMEILITSGSSSSLRSVKQSFFSKLHQYCLDNSRSPIYECDVHGCVCDDDVPAKDVWIEPKRFEYFEEHEIEKKCDGIPGGEICEKLKCFVYSKKREFFPLCSGYWPTDYPGKGFIYEKKNTGEISESEIQNPSIECTKIA